MARRQRLSEQEIAAYARRAVDEVAQADDPEAAAEQVLREAPDDLVGQAIVEMSTGASDRITGALVSAALRRGDAGLAEAAADLLPDLAQSPYALEVLRQCFGSEGPSIRRRAIEALEGFADPAVVALLAEGLRDESAAVSREATGTLGLIVGTRYHPLREGVLKELSDPQSALSRAITANPDTQVRRQAAQGLSFAGSDAVLPTLQALCEDEDVEVRQEVVLCLGAIGSASAVELMATRLNDPTYRVASSVLDMLAAGLGNSSAELLPHLQRAMTHPLAEVRRHAVLMLDSFGLSQARSVLETATGDEDFEVARRAGEMLRRQAAEAGLGWLGEELAGRSADDKVLAVWEAGNIGLEAGAQAGTAGSRDLDELIAALETALTEGSSSDKVHALNELSGLLDIGDSPAMRDVLNDEDSSVRSRAADTLTYSRDAGFLGHVLRTHPDPMVRRRAIEAMAGNPGGPEQRGALGLKIAFASARTAGMELFSYFLSALGDPDEGVRQHACGAIRDCAQKARLLPVRETLRQLERLAGDEGASVLMQEDAEYAAETVREGTIARFIAGQMDDVLNWTGQLAQEARAVRWDQTAGAYAVEGAAGVDALERWRTDYGLSEEQSEAVRRAASGGPGLDGETAAPLLCGLTRDISAALDCIAHAARAVRLIAEEGWEAALNQWAAAVEGGLELDWGATDPVAEWQRRLSRLRKRAQVGLERARQSFAAAPSSEALARMAADEDDWVKLAALTAKAGLDADPSATLEQMRALCEAHLGEGDYHEPIGRAAVALLDAGVGEPAGPAEFALLAASIDFRMELTRQLLVAAQKEDAAARLKTHLAGRTVEDVPTLCLALALRGAGHSLTDLSIAESVAEGEDAEAACAYLALRAMDNDSAAAQALLNTLREGDPEQRYRSASYLGLARVRSAALIFASVSDQDAPYMLRGLCAASLMRHGHPAGPGWFDKVLKSAGGGVKTGLLIHLSRAVEDTIPMMLECKDVNIGRFV